MIKVSRQLDEKELANKIKSALGDLDFDSVVVEFQLPDVNLEDIKNQIEGTYLQNGEQIEASSRDWEAAFNRVTRENHDIRPSVDLEVLKATLQKNKFQITGKIKIDLSDCLD